MGKALIEHLDQKELEAEIIRRFIGIQYVHKGRDEKVGLDCWGLPLLIYQMVGVKLFDIPDLDYGERWSKEGGNFLAENAWKDWDKVAEPKFLDGVLFRNFDGVAYHGGVILLDGRFIHCCKLGVVVHRWTDEKWKNLAEGYYRLRKLYEPRD